MFNKKILLAVLAILMTALTITVIYSEKKYIPFNNNIFIMDYEKEWKAVSQELEDLNYVIEDFTMSFQKDGTLDRMEFQLIGAYLDNFMQYSVKVIPNSNQYTIKGQKLRSVLNMSTCCLR